MSLDWMIGRARRIAANIAKLPDLLRQGEKLVAKLPRSTEFGLAVPPPDTLPANLRTAISPFTCGGRPNT
jgi:hypothetical protein